MKNKVNDIIEFINIFDEVIIDIISSEKYKNMDKFIQHGKTSCFCHSIAVAYYSFKFFEFFGIKYDVKSLIKGALLHDYFLYDWHENDKSHRLHGFRHPKTALKNAMRDFNINVVEKNIIERHMFPLTLIPPKYRESVVVCLVDKGCSIYETFNKGAYSELKNIGV